MPDAIFRCALKVQVRFKDVDKMGHVNNANHLTYFELARMHYFSEVVGGKIDWEKEGIILARMEIDYRMPILLEDELWAYARISRIGRTSFDFEYELRVKRDGQNLLTAVGKSVQVCYSYIINQPIPVPEIWKEKVFHFEGQLPGLKAGEKP
jgi:acyl-CoA thioester hydrolase